MRLLEVTPSPKNQIYLYNPKVQKSQSHPKRDLTLLLMKTPERSRTSRDPQLYSPFAQKPFCLLWIERHAQINYVMPCDVMTSYRDVM